VKSYKQFCKECSCKDKERSCKDKERKDKKKATVEVMPTVKDGVKGMVTKATNEGFAGDYKGPLYAPHPELQEKAPPGAKYERMVKHIKKGYSDDGKLSDKEKSIAYATAWKMKNKNK